MSMVSHYHWLPRKSINRHFPVTGCVLSFIWYIFAYPLYFDYPRFLDVDTLITYDISFTFDYLMTVVFSSVSRLLLTMTLIVLQKRTLLLSTTSVFRKGVISQRDLVIIHHMASLYSNVPHDELADISFVNRNGNRISGLVLWVILCDSDHTDNDTISMPNVWIDNDTVGFGGQLACPWLLTSLLWMLTGC